MFNIKIKGTVNPRFEKVKQVFASFFADGLENGAAVSLVVDGKLVVDIWAGHIDKAKTKEWQRDTIVNVWSSTKGVVATAVAMLVEQGRLHYDRPIGDVWPEFVTNGKEHINLDQVMSHTSGLNGLNTEMTPDELYAWSPYVNALAAMTPNWKPGTVCAYHALSYGHLAGEPLRRVTGKTIGQFVAEEIASPLGIEFFIGLPESHDHRVAEMIEGAGFSLENDFETKRASPKMGSQTRKRQYSTCFGNPPEGEPRGKISGTKDAYYKREVVGNQSSFHQKPMTHLAFTVGQGFTRSKAHERHKQRIY